MDLIPNRGRELRCNKTHTQANVAHLPLA